MKIKKLIALVLVVCTIASFSGCSLNFFSIESLLAPPKQPGKNGEVQEAFNELMKGKTVQFKTPASGDYQTSVVLKDINGDDVEEAFVFYSDTSLVEGSVRFAFMEYKNREWILSADVKGAGNGVYDVCFEDINNDGAAEIFVSWSLIEAGASKILTAYELTREATVTVLNNLSNEYCNAHAFVDFNGDGKMDLVLVYLDDTGPVQRSYLRLFTLQNELVKYGEIALDSSIVSVDKIFADKLNSEENGEYSRIFLECSKNDRMCFTELVYWDNNYAVPVRAFKQPSVSTLRNKGVYSKDIDGDGLFEIPSLTTLYGDESTFKISEDEAVFTLSLLKWNHVCGDREANKLTTLHNSKDNYLLVFPWGKSVTVYYDTLRNALLFCKWNEAESKRGVELFSVSYREGDNQNEIIGDLLYKGDRGAFYFDITDSGRSFGITDDFINSSFIYLGK